MLKIKSIFLLIFSFKNAHITQIKISQLTKDEKDAFDLEKNKQLEIKKNTLKKQHENAMQALLQKFQSEYNTFKKKRAIEVEAMLIKFKNKLRHLDLSQKKILSQYEMVAKDEKKTGILFILFIDPKVNVLRLELRNRLCSK